ncbi:MAG: TIGR00268 family protein, partial [Ignavibacteriales bacterium]
EGTNISDLGDYRPGLAAVKNMERVHSPFLKCNLDKATIRKLARAAGLDNWDQPSQACLASRIPYGEPLTVQKLTAVSKAEEFLHESGFSQVRVRHHGDLAKIEVLGEEMPALLDPRQRESISLSIKSCGFKYITFDIDGYRTGSLNEVLKDSQ